MATLGLEDEELRSVEQLLNRLSQLSSSIQSLKADVIRSNPLPNPDSLRASVQILQRNLKTVLEGLDENAELFTRMAMHPSTNFPGRTQEAVLTQLLRKKLEPDVEELVALGRARARQVTPAGVAALHDIWDDVRAWTNARIASHVREEARDAYTKAERAMGVENVRTGLRRDIEDEDDEDDEDEDEDESGSGGGADNQDDDELGGGLRASAAAQRGPEIETLLWFAARADFDLPRNIEYERQAAVGAGRLMRGLDGINLPPETVLANQQQV